MEDNVLTTEAKFFSCADTDEKIRDAAQFLETFPGDAVQNEEEDARDVSAQVVYDDEISNIVNEEEENFDDDINFMVFRRYRDRSEGAGVLYLL